MDAKETRVLVVEDDPISLEMMLSLLKNKGYKVQGASNVEKADELIFKAMKTSRCFDVAIVDLHLYEDGLGSVLSDSNEIRNTVCRSGAILAKRLKNIVPETKIIIVTGDADEADKMRHFAEGIIIKPVLAVDLFNSIENLLDPKARNKEKVWKVSRVIGDQAVNSLDFLTTRITRDEKFGKDCFTEKITGVTADDHKVNCVVYNAQTNGKVDPSRKRLSLSSCIGCAGMCKFCINPFYRERAGKVVSFIRQLSVSEIVWQFYQAILSNQLKSVFEGGSLKVNFASEGDWSFNVDNCCNAIAQLASISDLDLSFVMTSIGRESSLARYAKNYMHLGAEHHWSVNTLDKNLRSWLMPGIKHENLASCRDLYQTISEVSGKPVTASFIVMHGLNDSSKDASLIADFFKDRPFRVKLMALTNNALAQHGISNTADEHVQRFSKKLVKAGVKDVRIKYVFGAGGHSGCGTTRFCPGNRKPVQQPLQIDLFQYFKQQCDFKESAVRMAV